jgi:hemerythrin-like metal-binding protein
MPIQWTAELALGVPELDGQHLQMDACLRQLHDPLCEGRVPDVAEVLRELREVSAAHFGAEERIMASGGYAGLAEHVDEHRLFSRRLDEFEAARARDGASVALAMALGNFLSGWIRDHQRHDGALRGFVAPTRREGGG